MFETVKIDALLNQKEDYPNEDHHVRELRDLCQRRGVEAFTAVIASTVGDPSGRIVQAFADL